MKDLKKLFVSCKKGCTAGQMAEVLLLLLTPVTAFYLMQFVYGGYPWAYSFSTVLGNALCIAAVYYGLCALTGKTAICSIFVHFLFGLIGAANYYVMVFRGTPILPWDITAFRTAAAVSGSYQLFLTWQMTAGIVLFLALTVFLIKGMKKGLFSMRKVNARLVILAAAFLCLKPVLDPDTFDRLGIKTDVWNQGMAYRNMGIPAEFLCNIRFMKVEKPEGYSDERVKDLLAEAVNAEVEETHSPIGLAGNDNTGFSAAGGAEVKEPHIIAIMNESWADFEEFGNLSLNISPMEYISSLDAVHGHAYTSVFGAGTSASEFEFLTGNTMAFLPSGSIPYQQYILEPSQSLASLLKEKGYTTVAVHPGEKTSWQRNKAYPLLGFDTFKCEEDMDVALTTEHGYVSDQSSFDQIIYEFEHRKQDEKLFLFNVTIQNHGSYTDKEFPTEIYLAGEPGKYPKAEQYLTLTGKTDEAFKKLVSYFENQEEPVLIVMFGDHQPSLEQGFFDEAYGVEQKDMTMEQYMGKFRVPYLIWANYDIPKGEPGITSLNFLSQQVLEYAGIDSGAYGAFLREFQKEIPALTFSGYFGRDGKAYSHLETNRLKELIEKYQTVQYGILFGD